MAKFSVVFMFSPLIFLICRSRQQRLQWAHNHAVSG